MTGKKKCKMLREIRRRIATENDIAYITEDCKYKGDCKGTCPKCESEVRYLEEQLEKRRSLGKKVTVSALAIGLIAGGAAGCKPQVAGYRAPATSDLAGAVADPEPDTYVLEGEVAVDETEEDESAAEDETEAEGTGSRDGTETFVELEGDVPYNP